VPKPGRTGPVDHSRPVRQQDPQHVIRHTRPSHLENPATRGHFTDARKHQQDFRRDHMDQYRNIQRSRDSWKQDRRHDFQDRSARYRGFYRDRHYRYYYSDYYSYGFFGGFYYPVRALTNIDAYFYYPTVYFLYNDDVDDDYNRDWYGSDYRHYDAFNYSGVFYPTDTIRDCAIEVSGLPYAVQGNFRTGLNVFVARLQDAVNANLQVSITFDRGDVTVNHYKNLKNQALVLEGFVDNGTTSLAFKAFLDLNDPNQTSVFVPADQTPSAEDLANLNSMNQRIIGLGGDPMSADQEPQN
jgi:hypothetical protein